MKHIKVLGATLLFLSAIHALAADPSPLRTDINPALIYYRSFILTPQLDATNSQYLYDKDWRGQKLPERFGSLVSRYDNQFKLLRAAARAAVPCDWGIDFSPGPNTMLPYLARVKAATQMARLRTLWDLQNHQEMEARDDLLAAYVIGRNASHDGTLIGTLVQFACEAIVYSTIAENFNRFSPETLKQLVNGFDAAPATGTISAAIAGERAGFRDWMILKIQQWQKEYPGNDGKVMDTVHQFVDEMFNFPDSQENKTNLWPHISAASGGTSDGVIRLFRESNQFYNRLTTLTALPLPEFEIQIKQFDTDVQKSANPFVNSLVPTLKKARSREFRIGATEAMVRAAVEYRLHGMDGFKKIADPCGNGPFTFERFVFKGVDRGFKLTSAYQGSEFPVALIFVEKDGPAFYVEGPTNSIGQPVKK